MANAQMKYKEMRFVIEDELTIAYVLIEAIGDCPIGVQGWHSKTFPASVSVDKILERISDSVLWPMAAPEDK